MFINNKESRKVYIIHEYGANNHYLGLDYLCKHNCCNVVYVEFSILPKIYRSIFTLDLKLFFRQIYNVLTLLNLYLFKREELIILGIAPYDIRCWFFNKMAKRNSVYLHTSWPYWDGSRVPKSKRNIPIYWTEFLEQNVKGIFCVTNHVKKGLQAQFNLNCPIQAVGHSVVWDVKEDNLIVCKCNDSIKCLFVGRLTKSKGIDIISDLVKVLDSKKFEFSFVGDGDMKENVEELSRLSNVEYFGSITSKVKLKNIFQNSDILFLPSLKDQNGWEELFGMVIIEALSCGCVPIVTNQVGPNEILNNTNAGFIFTSDNYFSETEKLLNEFLNDRILLNSYKTNAYLLGRNYTMKTVATKWNKILKFNLD